MSLCGSFQKNSNAVHDWLIAQPHVKEESLTDWFLYRVDVERSDVAYRAFTRHEEARTTGADWEWWIVFPSGAMRFRVQAKKLTAGDNFPGLAHSNKHGMQITKLLDDARRVNAFPLYAFYSTKTSGVCPWPSPIPEGVHLASAAAVDRLIAHRAYISDVDALALGIPISCLVCCPLVTKSPGLSGLVNFVGRYLSATLDVQGQDSIDGQYSRLPDFVERFMQRDLPDDVWEREYARSIDGIDALLVMDLRSDSSLERARDR